MTDRESLVFRNATRIAEDRARHARRLQARELGALLAAFLGGVRRSLRAAQSVATTLFPVSR